MRTTIVMFIALVSATVFADEKTDAANVVAGKAVYSQTCIACHSANGKGAIPGIQDLTGADGPLSKSDEELVTSIVEGFQSAGSPIAMPPKGGNPSLTDEDIRSVIVYLRAEFGD